MGLASHQDHKARSNSATNYVRHRPETTLLYQIVQEYWPEFQAELASHGRYLPAYVTKEFDEFLKCGRLEHGFLRVRCEACRDEKLLAFSCKKRGFCPSCGARRMADSAALLVDDILPYQPMRQWVLSVPFPLRFLFASNPKVMTRALAIVYRTIATHLTHKAGFTKPTARTGAVTLIQRFGSAPNSKYRARVTPARRGKQKRDHSADETDQTPAEKWASITWAKRLKRVFNLDVETCDKCGGDVRIIASIEDPVVIQKILAHLDNTASSAAAALLPDCRASPSLPAGLFD